jgi:hypothetical protein
VHAGFVGLVEVTMDRILGRFIEALDVMNELDVGFDILSSGVQIVLVEIRFAGCFLEVFADAFSRLFAHKFQQRLNGTILERFVGSWNGWAEISSRGLQTRVRSAFSSTMKAYLSIPKTSFALNSWKLAALTSETSIDPSAAQPAEV